MPKVPSSAGGGRYEQPLLPPSLQQELQVFSLQPTSVSSDFLSSLHSTLFHGRSIQGLIVCA